MTKEKLLVFQRFYLPGFRGGGPIRSIANLVQSLSDRYEFYIITSDRDIGDHYPYPNVVRDEWVQVGDAQVLYCSKLGTRPLATLHAINAIQPALIYVNGVLSLEYAIYHLLRRAELLRGVATVVSPRGDLLPERLKLKACKKTLFIRFLRTLQLDSRVLWHVTSDSERDSVVAQFGASTVCEIIPNLPSTPPIESALPEKQDGQARFAFFSRIANNKQLHVALKLVAELKGDITFTILGPIEDRKYWQSCQEQIERMPGTVHVEYKGSVEPDAVFEELGLHQFLLLPTTGENYGHAILEAMLVGLVPIISNRTPWRELRDKSVGWDLPLMDENAWLAALNECVTMDQRAFAVFSANSRGLAIEAAKQSHLRAAYAHMFDSAISRVRGPHGR